MVAIHKPPDRPTAAVATDRARAARLLDEAEQIARALPLDEHAMAAEDRAAAIPGPPPPPASSSAATRGLDHDYDRSLPLAVQRARALVHVATVAARSDPAHAARLLGDALHPGWNQAGQGTAGYNHILEALIWHSAAEFGMLLARIDPAHAKRLVADIEKIPAVVRALRHREFLDDVAPFIAKVAEVVAEVDVASAEDLVRPMGAPARDMALATIAATVARTDPTWARRIALAVTGRPGQAPGQGRPEREQPPPLSMLAEPDQAMYWKVRALTEIAIAAATAEADRPARPDDAERFARSISEPGTVRDVAPTTAETAAAQIDPDQAGQLLEEAEQWARAIGKSDLQAKALTSVKVAEAWIDPDHAEQLLTEAEQYIRTIGGASARLEALEEVALAAARTNPAQAEQVIHGLPPGAPGLAEVAMAAARTDPACGERIAASSADEYVQALVGAVIAVRTDPATAGPRLEQAVAAAGDDPARVAEIAMVVAPADPDRAERAALGIKAGAGMAAGYWRARTLAGLADACIGGITDEN